MAINLANKAFSHLIITIDSIIPFVTDKDLFIYNITTSCYTVDRFLGIIINIKASKRSTAEYSQFLTFQRLNTGIQLNTTTQGIVNI